MGRSKALEFDGAEEMPEGIFDVVGIHFAVDLELIESLLEFPCVVQSDPALP